MLSHEGGRRGSGEMDVRPRAHLLRLFRVGNPDRFTRPGIIIMVIIILIVICNPVNRLN